MTEPNREKALFEQALDYASADEQAAFLRQACAGDPARLERIQALLQADAASPQFLPPWPGLPANTLPADAPVAEGPGSVIGRYQLLEPIGEGGFGIVFLAEQLEPVRRRVALKLIKSGMDSKQVIGRFEAERQALALMNHPNIAQVFDAGTTPAGRPYFVMELVNGLPITRFCDERPLDLEARLHLFLAVCGAVQHAHQKGVIHRDLKPSNILVTLPGDQPVPKVIDFGIAKAIEQPLTALTVFTQFPQLLGTPAYMSPEQAALSGRDVDTRSDIYSLGVLLYELLTGSPPFDSKELLSVGLDEMRRILREQEPVRPSTRLRKSLAAAAAPPPPGRHRPRITDHESQIKSHARLPSDLDWIVLKALAKDPDRRYATVSGLAADLQRFLHHEPVTARAPTLRYQLAKLYRRNRKTVVTALAMAALLLVATGVSTGLAVRAHRAEVRAREQAATARNVSDFLWRELLKRLTPWSHTNAGVSLREAFESAAGRIDYRLSRQPLAEASVRFVFGKTYAGLWEYAAAESNLIRAIELQRRHGGAPDEPLAEFLSQLAELRVHQGRLAQAEPLYREAADIFARRLGDTHRDAVSAAAKLASVQARRLPPAEAEPLLQHHLERTTRFVAADHYVARQTLNQLGELRRDAGNLDAAHDLFAQAHRLTVAEEGEFSAGAMWGLELMAQTRARQRQYAEAEQMLRHVVATRARTISPDHPAALASRRLLIQDVLLPQRRFADAALLLLEAAETVQPTRADFRPALAAGLAEVLEAWRAGGGGPEFERFAQRAAAHLGAATKAVFAPAPDVP